MRHLIFHPVFYPAFCALFTLPAAAQTQPPKINPAVTHIVAAISEQRIAATLKKLESFGTRHTLSPQDDPAHGIGAAMRWLHDEFQSYSPRLEVSYQPFTIQRGGTAGGEVPLANVVAVLPGTTAKGRYVLVTAHYDSIHIVRKPASTDQERLAGLIKQGMEESEARRYMELFPASETASDADAEATAAQAVAPGVTDDGCGTAAGLELARVMSQHQFGKTLVFIAFSAEEGSHAGSKAYAAYAQKNGMQIEAVLNNDIIGSDVAGNGRTANNVLRGFAAGPEDSGDRAALRYIKETAERYVPQMHVEMVFHLDRFARGGDHMSFVDAGYPAVRLTTPAENYANQHSATDTFANASVPYTTRVARMNAAVAASLALAPSPPVVSRPRPAPAATDGGRQGGGVAGIGQGGRGMQMLGRGKGYDAAMRWLAPNPESDLAGYAVVIRRTTSAVWEREIYVGNVTEYTIPNLSIDDVVLGVKAIDKDGNSSLVSAYDQAPLTVPVRPATPATTPPAPGGGER